MQPSDSLTSIGASSGLPLLGTYLGANAVLCPWGQPRPRPQRRGCRRVVTGSPAHRISIEETGGPPRSLGCPLAACRGRTPRRVRSVLALLHALRAIAFRPNEALGTRNDPKLSWLRSHGPRARVPTHRPERYRSRRKAHYQLGGLLLRWAGLAPAGQLTEFHEIIASFVPF